MPASFRAKDLKEIVELRKHLYDQNTIPGLKPLTAWRIEHGRPCKRETAETYHSALRTNLPFGRFFELATDEDYYGWGRVEDAAVRVGEFLFGDFKATAVVTYVGPSAVFASLAMAKSSRADGALLTTPVYPAMHMTLREFKKMRAPHGFTPLNEDQHEPEADQCVVLVPKALDDDDKRRTYRIAIIDDAIMTGRPLRLVKRHLLETLGYKADRIKVGCCVCHIMILTQRDETTPAPGAYGFSTNIDPRKGSVRFPWGKAIFFPPSGQ
jgi:hypothetical protein